MSWSKLTREEKLDLMKYLNWEYKDTHEDMLAVIEGEIKSSGAFTRDKLFVRSMERLNWYSFIGLWGIETIKEMYTEELAKRIWPKSRRKNYDISIAILRGETIPTPRWGDEYYQQTWGWLLSDRWNGLKPRIFSSPLLR